jgi:hypothetical protein
LWVSTGLDHRLAGCGSRRAHVNAFDRPVDALADGRRGDGFLVFQRVRWIGVPVVN